MWSSAHYYYIKGIQHLEKMTRKYKSSLNVAGIRKIFVVSKFKASVNIIFWGIHYNIIGLYLSHYVEHILIENSFRISTSPLSENQSTFNTSLDHVHPLAMIAWREFPSCDKTLVNILILFVIFLDYHFYLTIDCCSSSSVVISIYYESLLFSLECISHSIMFVNGTNEITLSIDFPMNVM